MGRATVTTGKSHPQGQRGFTLIELLIVVTLIVVLAGIGLSTYSTSVNRAKEAVLRENLFRLRDSIDQFYADKGTYPPDLTSLVTEGYMRQIPEGSVHRIRRHLANRHVRARPRSPKCSAGCVRRQERRRRRQHRRHAVHRPAITRVKSPREDIAPTNLTDGIGQPRPLRKVHWRVRKGYSGASYDPSLQFRTGQSDYGVGMMTVVLAEAVRPVDVVAVTVTL